ncbi:MAG: hypothetical protein COA94_07910 [Rickettsiales bacterium]|nr:MAG: hypothetical protein COA94_07910 [Rickettsiales bacterium]
MLSSYFIHFYVFFIANIPAGLSGLIFNNLLKSCENPLTYTQMLGLGVVVKFYFNNYGLVFLPIHKRYAGFRGALIF